MRKIILLLSMLCGAGTMIPAVAQVSVGVNIGLNIPVFPQLQPIPGYPVYYAPQMDTNYFFYDGMYWVFVNDSWYASSWYNGPWAMMEPMMVPVYIYRVPVRYYRSPPVFLQGGPPDAPPRWDAHYGPDWQRRYAGWDHWDRRSAPPPAPLPTYQRQYSGSRYPSVAQQPTITSREYPYTPHEPVDREHYQQLAHASSAAPPEPQHLPQAPRQPPQAEPPEHRLPQALPPQHEPPQATEQNHPPQAPTERTPDGRTPEGRNQEGRTPAEPRAERADGAEQNQEKLQRPDEPRENP